MKFLIEAYGLMWYHGDFCMDGVHKTHRAFRVLLLDDRIKLPKHGVKQEIWTWAYPWKMQSKLLGRSGSKARS